MAADDSKPFEGWAILELMGHRRLAGYVTEVEVAGSGMLRLDVPENPWQDGCTCGSQRPDSTYHQDHTHVCGMFREEGDDKPLDVYATQFYSPSALYCLTPTTEQTARTMRSRPAPVSAWELPRPALPVGVTEERESFDDEDRPF